MEETAATTTMSAATATRLVLADHAEAFMREFQDLQWTETFSDLAIHVSPNAATNSIHCKSHHFFQCRDGVVRSHRIIASASSPMLRHVLSNSGDDDPCLVLPDVTVTQMASLLSLVYHGEANLYQRCDGVYTQSVYKRRSEIEPWPIS